MGRRSKAKDVSIPWRLYAQNESALDWSIHSIEAAHQLEALGKLRKASLGRYRRFTDENGRFHHLQIDEAILAGIPDLKRKDRQLIDENIKLNESRKSLEESLSFLWQESCPHVIVTGSGGMGKTVALLQLWAKWSQAEDPGSPVPIFIQLNEFNNHPTENFIRKYIQEQFAEEVALDELLKKANVDEQGQKRPHLILLLDGLNEVSVNNNELLSEINQLRLQENYPGVQIVTTSRIDIRDAYQWQELHLLDLEPLTDKQIEDFLNKALPTNIRLLELLRNPMMLSIYAAQSELPERYQAKGYLKETVSSTGEMLHNVEAIQRIWIETSFQKDLTTIAYRRFILEHLLPFIGWEMQQKGLFFITKKSDIKKAFPGLQDLLEKGLETLLTDDFFDTFSFFDQHLEEERFEIPTRKRFKDIIETVARKELSIVIRDGENYRFLHQNFRDYFAARHVQNQIQVAIRNSTLPEVLCLTPLDLYVRQLLGELEGEHTNKLDWNKETREWQWSNGQFSLNNCFADLLELCRNDYDQEKMGYTLWNILTIWAEQRGELSGAQLQGLDLQGFYLNGYRATRPGLSMHLSKGNISAENLFPQGHSDRVSSTAYSPDGSRIVTGSADRTAKVWDAQTGKCLLTLEGHTGIVSSTAYSPDGARIVTGSADRTANVWGAQTGKCLLSLGGHLGYIHSAAYSPDGSRLITGSHDGTVKVWDAQTLKCMMTLESDRNTALAYSPDGLRIVIDGCDDNTAKVWDAQSGKCLLTLEGHSSLVMSTAYSPDGLHIVTGSHDSTAKVWDAQSGKCLLTLPNIPGLIIHGCDFRDLQLKSGLKEEEIALLRQYGGIFSEEDAQEWERLMEVHFA